VSTVLVVEAGVIGAGVIEASPTGRW
jgi:hypothetical protein